jgi:hypothetical protein
MRLNMAIITGALAMVAASAAHAVDPAIAPGPGQQPRPYISRFCAAIALNDVDPALLRQLYSDWGAHSAGDETAQAFRPDDPETPGQMAEFADKDAPKAFIEPRRGMCSLVYSSQHVPTAVTAEFRTATLSVRKGAAPTAWRRLASKRLGGGGPIRYFLPTSEDGNFGVCGAIYDDLRLHDSAPATLVRVQTCRLSDDETFDNG